MANNEGWRKDKRRILNIEQGISNEEGQRVGQTENRGLWPELVFEPVVSEEGEVFEVNSVVAVQIGWQEQRQVEDAGAVGSGIGNLGFREGIVVNSEVVD